MTVLSDQQRNVRVPGQGARAMKRRVVLFTPVAASDDVDDVIDDGGDNICIEWKVKNSKGEFVRNTDGNLLEHDFCFEIGD